MNNTPFYSPPDVLEAHDAWNANCGPCSLAAILQRPVMDVQAFFPAFPGKPWVNPTAMKEALRRAGRQQCDCRAAWPKYGLAFIQIEGPWEQPGVPVGASYRHTHWIGAADVGVARAEADRMVYDANMDCWESFQQWRDELVPRLLAEHKRSTGWRVRMAMEVRP